MEAPSPHMPVAPSSSLSRPILAQPCFSCPFVTFPLPLLQVCSENQGSKNRAPQLCHFTGTRPDGRADPAHLTHGQHTYPADHRAPACLAQTPPVAPPGLTLLVESLPGLAHLIPSLPFFHPRASLTARPASLF